LGGGHGGECGCGCGGWHRLATLSSGGGGDWGMSSRARAAGARRREAERVKSWIPVPEAGGPSISSRYGSRWMSFDRLWA